MKTLYLHIGTPKTATTAIQTFCWDNREVLEKHNYCYPMFEYQYFNAQKYRNGHFLVGKIIDENGVRQCEQEQVNIREGLEQIFQYFEQYDNVILSDEGIWNRSLLEDMRCWRLIHDEFVLKDIMVKVIVYFRRQDDFLFSWWNQQIKEGMHNSSVLSWDEVVETKPFIKMDYYDVLTKIAEQIGKENITVRLFDRKQFAGGSIQADFLEAVGLHYTDEFQILTPMKNPSLTKNNIEIKRVLNMLPELEKKENDRFRKLLTQLSEGDTSDRTQSMFSEEEYRQFMESYNEGNRRIAQEYLGRDGDLFDDAYNAETKWDCQNDQMI
ncbi:MAG: hypothetical protein ACI4A3_11625, partial [Lachnospiraceae bacterium]